MPPLFDEDRHIPVFGSFASAAQRARRPHGAADTDNFNFFKNGIFLCVPIRLSHIATKASVLPLA